MNRAERRKNKLTAKRGFKPIPNICQPRTDTLWLGHKSQERKEFLAACYKRGMYKYEAMSKWGLKEGLILERKPVNGARLTEVITDEVS